MTDDPQVNEHFQDPERDRRPGLDVSSLTVDAARQASRGCEPCDGGGFATVYDYEYAGSPVITYVGPDQELLSKPGRVSAYCECAAGRNIMEKHRSDAKDVHYRTPDYCEIKGKQSFWLEHDPTLPRPSETPTALTMTRAEMLRAIMGGKRITHDKAEEARDSRDRIRDDFTE